MNESVTRLTKQNQIRRLRSQFLVGKGNDVVDMKGNVQRVTPATSHTFYSERGHVAHAMLCAARSRVYAD